MVRGRRADAEQGAGEPQHPALARAHDGERGRSAPVGGQSSVAVHDIRTVVAKARDTPDAAPFACLVPSASNTHTQVSVPPPLSLARLARVP
eukprot:4759393-Prymnesium_polylepis.2